MANDIKFHTTFFSLLFALIISLAAFIPVKAKDAVVPYTFISYDIDYISATKLLLSLKGQRTTDNDLYFLSCVLRTHLEHKNSMDSILGQFPKRQTFPTINQIKLVEDVINNSSNECYHLYIVLPSDLISDDSGFVTVVSNNLSFISYETFIIMTVQPNL